MNVPHVAPPHWPERVRQGRFASTIVLNTPELSEDNAAAATLIDKCQIALLGIPDDTGVALNHGRTGAALGPAAFRAAWTRYGAAAAMIDSGPHLSHPRVFDAGDVIVGQTIQETHDRISDAAAAIVARGLLPIAIGGGHDCTYAFVRGVARALGPLAGVYFDAHLDVRPEVGSGMSFRALVEEGLSTRLHVVGLDPQSNTQEHFDYFRLKGHTTGALSDYWPHASRPQFVSLDMDVFDMAYAPGVSAMNPCGLAPAQVATSIEAAGRNHDVVCFDIMELSPPHDEHGRTARLAVYMLQRFLRGYAHRSGARA